MSRLLVVSNRLPVTVERTEGELRAVPAVGGLVSAVDPVLRERGAEWIGWTGTTEPAEALAPLLEDVGRRLGYRLRAISLDDEEVHGYYRGFSNEILWPLFHDFVSRCNFRRAYWPVFERVNARFASAIRKSWHEDDVVWVQDYHLSLVGRFLREQDFRGRTAFFLHVPFPPPDIYLRLPWRAPLLGALLAYDLLGFQTARDRRNFLQCVRQLFPTLVSRGRSRVATIVAGEREVRVGAFPISIDFNAFARRAEQPAVEVEIGRILRATQGRQLVLGVDRLDYSKGIPERLRAFSAALEQEPGLRGRVCLLQVVVPSRTRVTEYQEFKTEIDQLIGTINGRFGQTGWTPVDYRYRTLTPDELVAHYRAADVALVTPLKDGMNLVAKEYCASRVDGDGVLVLSEFAGAAAELRGKALLVNPYDVDGTATTLREALIMGEDERRQRMTRMRAHVRRNDVHAWMRSFLAEIDQPADPVAGRKADLSSGADAAR